MPYQIIGFREGNKVEHFTWLDDLRDVFTAPATVLKDIPKDQQYNLYYSVADIVEGTSRHEGVQHYLPFDIDHIDREQPTETVEVALEALGLNYDDAYSIFSGNGVQFLIPLRSPIDKEHYANGYFDEHRPYYLKCCEQIQKALEKHKLPGTCDASVFKNTQVMRVPGTWNKKKNKPNTKSYVLNQIAEPLEFDVKQFGQVELAEYKGSYNSSDVETAAKTMTIIDTQGVLEGCEFLKWAKANQKDVTEPQWYAETGVLGWLENGHELVHEYSRDHPSYTRAETDRKLKQALDRSGPRTCRDISSRWDGCSGCEHFNKCTTPLQIKRDSFVATKTNGFREIILKNGKPAGSGPPNYKDLCQYADEQFGVLTDSESGNPHKYKKTYWEMWPKQEILAYANQHITNPGPNHAQRVAFYEEIRVTNCYRTKSLMTKSAGKLNLKNGVFDIKTGELLPHSREFFFTYELPYEYDKDATCPRFDQFLDEVTMGREDIQHTITEYMAYALSNDEYWKHKVLVLLGHGRNGKGALMRLLQSLAGDDNYSTNTIRDLSKPQNVATLENKLFNISGESGKSIYEASEEFKSVTGGDSITVKRLYMQPYTIKPRAKWVVACNTLPKAYDDSDGFFSRFLIVPFDRTFNAGEQDGGLDAKLASELPGIVNRLVPAYKRLHANKEFTESAESKKAIEDYKKELIPEIGFVEDMLTVSYNEESWDKLQKVTNVNMYRAYCNYCKENNHRAKDSIRFFKSLRQAIPDIDKRKKKTNGTRYIAGVGMDVEIKEWTSLKQPWSP